MMLTPILQQMTEFSRVAPPSQHAERPPERHSHPAVLQPAPLETAHRSNVANTGPFAAELDVIQQRARNAGPSRAILNADPDVRRRDSERALQRPTPSHPGDYRPRDSSQQTQHAVSEGYKYVCSLPEHIREDYTLLKEQLTQRFGQQDLPTIARRKLGELRQLKGSAAEFAEEIRRLVTVAYPGVDLELQDKLAVDAFLKGLKNQKVAYEVMNREPHSLLEAQRLAEAHEQNYRATVGREVDTRGRARRISWADEENTYDDLHVASRRVQSPSYATADKFATLAEKTACLADSVEKIKCNYVTVDQLQVLINKLDQIEAKLAQPTAQSQTDKHVHHHGRRQGQQATPLGDQPRVHSLSPNRATATLCYRCGEEGHLQRECQRSPSPTVQPNSSVKEFSPATSTGRCIRQRSQSPTPRVSRATSRGPSLIISLTVNNIPVQAVVDTGAEATVISDSLYQRFHPSEQTASKKTCLRNAESGKEMIAMGGQRVNFQLGTRNFTWEVYVAPIRDHVLLGLDLLRAVNVTIYASGKAFIENELLPAKIVGGEGPDYHMARVLLEKDTTLPPECECLVWGEVDQPHPGVCAVLEPLNVSEAVASGSIATMMEKRVPVRLYNLSRYKAALPKGACLGLLVETYPEDSPETSHSLEVQHSSQWPEIRRIETATELPEHLQELFALSSEVLSDAQQRRLIALLLKYQTLFSASDSDLGYLASVTHKINTGTARPIRQPVRRTPLGFQKEEEKHLQTMLEADVVVPSSSEWASPVVLVRKKDGGVRWCIDYRRLNSVTVKDAYPLPKIEECLDVLGGANVFSTLDLQSGY
ncbi:hypothetical protein SRHO_G00070000 [Serrasalmus rhombeus]